MQKVTFNVMGGEVFAPAIYTKKLNEGYKLFVKVGYKRYVTITTRNV